MVDPAIIDRGWHGPGFHICGPRGVYFRTITECPEEKKKRRFVVFDEPWYGRRWHCCGCGDTWNADEGRERRPFSRRWRQKAIAKHHELWKIATTKKKAMQWIMDEIGV